MCAIECDESFLILNIVKKGYLEREWRSTFVKISEK